MRKTILIVSVLFIAGLIGIANAQQALPTGGDSFETAVEIQAGSYVTGHDISRKTQEYFKLPVVRAGQMLVVKATNLPTGVDLISNAILYNEDRVMLIPSYDNPLDNIFGAGEIGIYRWLPNSSQNSYVYYISIGGGDVNFTAQGTKYDISIGDASDAGSQTDAGDAFEKAIDITPGKYTGYLSGKLGIDTKDFYKLAVKKGETLTVKVTPPSRAIMKVVVYDSNRAVLKDVSAPNPGAIVTNSVPITRSGNVFAAIVCDKYCSEDIVAYTLDIISQAGVKLPEGETALPAGTTGEPTGGETVLPGGTTGWPTGEGLTGEELVKTGIKALIITLLVPMIIGLVVLAAVIVVIVILIRKKRQK